MVVGLANSITATNNRTFTNVAAFPLSQIRKGSGTRFSSRTVTIWTTFFSQSTYSTPAFMKFRTLVVFGTPVNTFIIDTSLTFQTIPERRTRWWTYSKSTDQIGRTLSLTSTGQDGWASNGGITGKTRTARTQWSVGQHSTNSIGTTDTGESTCINTFVLNTTQCNNIQKKNWYWNLYKHVKK